MQVYFERRVSTARQTNRLSFCALDLLSISVLHEDFVLYSYLNQNYGS